MKVIINDNIKANIFVNIFKYLSQISKDVNIYFNKKGIFIQTMDSNHVCMFELILLSEWFDEYNIEDNGYMIGINTEIFAIILKCKGNDHTIEIKYSETESEKLYIDFYGDDKDIDKHFKMPLMEIDTETQDFPNDAIWDANIIIASSVFQKLTTELLLFNDDVLFKCCKKELSVSTDGILTGSYETILNKEKLLKYSYKKKEPLSVSYNLCYFNYISNFANLCDDIEINVSSTLPLKVNCYLGNKKNYIRFYLAPKIEDFD